MTTGTEEAAEAVEAAGEAAEAVAEAAEEVAEAAAEEAAAEPEPEVVVVAPEVEIEVQPEAGSATEEVSAGLEMAEQIRTIAGEEARRVVEDHVSFFHAPEPEPEVVIVEVPEPEPDTPPEETHAWYRPFNRNK